MVLKMNAAELTAFLLAEFPQVADEFDIRDLIAVRLEVALRVRDKHLRPGGTVSGPSMFALADVAAYLHILALIGPKALAVTTNCGIDFLRKPSADADLLCKNEVVKLGRSLAV
ncbi:MAG: PaaI family thioesterase, partial [Planktomarina sp.]|nr:PaaI family thioesterase [Planktomarina sp.]